MSEDTYVVYLLDTEEISHFKHFRSFDDANSFAIQCVNKEIAEAAEILLVQGVSKPAAAIAAVQMGEGKFLVRRGRHRTEAEIRHANERAWEQANARGPIAVLEFLGLLGP